MRPLTRSGANKKVHAKKFKKSSKRTKAANMQTAPQRGGWRL